jgi:hypothetical protein
MGYCGEACRGFIRAENEPGCAELSASVRTSRGGLHPRAAEQTDDPVFRKMLLALALQWRQAAQEEAAKQSTEPKTADRAH